MIKPGITFSAIEWKRLADGWAKVQYHRELIKDGEYTEWKLVRTFNKRLTDKEYFVKKLDGTL